MGRRAFDARMDARNIVDSLFNIGCVQTRGLVLRDETPHFVKHIVSISA